MSRKRLMPGLYANDDELEVDCVELCLAFGWEPTRSNQERAHGLVLDTLQKLGIDPEVEEHEGPPPWRGFG